MGLMAQCPAYGAYGALGVLLTIVPERGFDSFGGGGSDACLGVYAAKKQFSLVWGGLVAG